MTDSLKTRSARRHKCYDRHCTSSGRDLGIQHSGFTMRTRLGGSDQPLPRLGIKLQHTNTAPQSWQRTRNARTHIISQANKTSLFLSL